MTNQINNSGFTIEQIYSLVGRYDYTSNITLRSGSDDELTYGNNVVGVFLFSKSERDDLELRIANSNKETYGRLRFCNLLPDVQDEKTSKMKCVGIDTRNIVRISWLPCTRCENIYPSRLKRSLSPIKIIYPVSTKSNILNETFEFYKKVVNDGIGLCPEEECRYLAYKMIIEPDQLTEKENVKIYNERGLLYDDIAYELLTIKFNTFSIKRKEINKIAKILAERYTSRLSLLNQVLNNAVKSFEELKKENPEIAHYILEKVQSFHQRRFNITGKHPLYLDLEGYIHILLRHVGEAQFVDSFEHKTKFQYDEHDTEIIMNEVLCGINADYQRFRESNPNDRYVKKDDDSCYFNGDYYVIVVNPNGSIVTFYKRDSSYLKKNLSRKNR